MIFFEISSLQEWIYLYENRLDFTLLLFALTLLAMAADANKADEIINSPERKPSKPIINTVPVKISF